MRLTVLGSGTSVPSARRGSPSFLLRLDGATALVDTGPGSLRQLARLGLAPGDVTDLFYTHAHPDHTADLWPFLFVSRSPFAPRSRPLRLHGSAAFFEFYRRVSTAFGTWAAAGGYTIEEVVHTGVAVPVGPASVRAFPVPHTASSVAWRFEEKGKTKTVVFSGDTDYGEAIIEAARGADLLVLECSTPDGEKIAGHLVPSLCARVAAEAGVGRLLLVHFYPPADRADVCSAVLAAWTGDVGVAEDLLEVEV
jgi:ribonuclease BN (tRNA processing enzyme)